ncbi:MAG: L,D-transpeptidase family protein [Candidatus Omnitrophica bacterium]|nr:L,D-transpeptidase family protein [Candidatus Omnitrophota bacterium]
MAWSRATTIGAAAVAAAAVGIGYWASHRPAPALWAAAGAGEGSPRRSLGRALSGPSRVAPADPGLASAAAIEQAIAQGRWVEARRLSQQCLQEHPDSSAAAQIQQRLGDINVHLLQHPASESGAPFYAPYIVQLGDTLGRIARQHKTTVELLQQANRLTGDKILVGRTLKVPAVSFSVVVDKSQNLLTLKANEEVVKTYAVSTGKEDQTPVGTFTIVNKLVDPPWYTAQGVIPAGSPENILGSRWLGFSKPSYGIHGTTDPSTIGQSVTAGCVRMRNAEVEELYAFLPLGADVTIVD